MDILVIAIIISVIAVLGISVVSNFSQVLAGGAERQLIGTAQALALSVGGVGMAVVAVLLLRGVMR
jgi:sensor histidine kinase regulating citrate/malate metabolism